MTSIPPSNTPLSYDANTPLSYDASTCQNSCTNKSRNTAVLQDSSPIANTYMIDNTPRAVGGIRKEGEGMRDKEEG